MSATVQITFDCADPNDLAAFWNEVLGYRYDSPPPGFETWEEALDHFGVPEEERNNASAAVDPEGVGPRLWFQKVPEGKVAKNRLHLDVRSAPGLEGDERMAALEKESERLVALGGRRLQRFEPAAPMSKGYLVMQDPDGNSPIGIQGSPEPSGVPTRGHIVMEDPEGNVFCLD